MALELGSIEKAQAVNREAEKRERSEDAALRRLGVAECIEEEHGPQAGQSGASIE